jgi:hypothetical protein
MDEETLKKLTFEPDQTIVLEAPEPSDTSHRIDIAFHRYGPKGAYYRVSYCRETLIESVREPVYSSCRALVAMGCKGRLEVWGGEPYAIGIAGTTGASTGFSARSAGRAGSGARDLHPDFSPVRVRARGHVRFSSTINERGR